MTVTTDLEWVLRSPSLIKLPSGSGITDATDWLTGLIEPAGYTESTLDEAIPAPRRLGFYYENIVEFIFNKSSQITVFKRNIQVKKDKITLGEFDFIGQQNQQIFHLECAVKFYLRVGKGDQLSDYIGPGKTDRLDKKYLRLLEHQLPLAKHRAAKDLLQQLNLIPQRQRLLLQGYLFHPWQEGCPEQLAPEINPAHLQGWWLRQASASTLWQDTQLQLMPLDKPYWLHARLQAPISQAEFNHWLSQQTRPVLVSRGIIDKGAWAETDRGFIVPDTW
ncbi:DUF1853 family protein [Pontibacter sp. JAM-7]|uniref:DUF1853 family protein n=1 Tax=Pontibacter sp. JAM-7 TaxID=3366581 RepID=UPI003AF49D67